MSDIRIKKLIIADIEGLTTPEEKAIVQERLKNDKQLADFYNDLVNKAKKEKEKKFSPPPPSEARAVFMPSESNLESWHGNDGFDFRPIKESFQDFLDRYLPYNPEKQQRIVYLTLIGITIALIAGTILIKKLTSESAEVAGRIKTASELVDEAKDDLNKFVDQQMMTLSTSGAPTEQERYLQDIPNSYRTPTRTLTIPSATTGSQPKEQSFPTNTLKSEESAKKRASQLEPVKLDFPSFDKFQSDNQEK